LGRSGSENSVMTCSATTLPEGSSETTVAHLPGANHTRTLSGQVSAGTSALSRDSSASGLVAMGAAGGFSVLQQQPLQREHSQAAEPETAGLGRKRSSATDQGEQFLLASSQPIPRQSSSLLAAVSQIRHGQEAEDAGAQGVTSDAGAVTGPVSDEALGVMAVERIMSTPVRWVHKDADLSQVGVSA
jgi:hypothetical protein